MGRQRFGISLPFLILILTEVILMSWDCEAASLSDARRWQKTRRAETTNSESSSPEYDGEKYANVDRKLSKKGNKARSNLKRTIQRSGNGKLKIKDKDLREENDIAYDETASKNKRGSWQCNGVHIPGDQINVVYSEKNDDSPSSKNPTFDGQTGNYFYPRTVEQKSAIDELKKAVEPVFKFIRTASSKSGINNEEGIQYSKSHDREKSLNNHSTVHRSIYVIRDLLNLITKNQDINYSKDKSRDSSDDLRRSEFKETGGLFRYLKLFIDIIFSNYSIIDQLDGISHTIESIPRIFQTIATLSNSFQQAVRSEEPARSDVDPIDPHGSYTKQFARPMHDVIKPLDTVLNPFKSDSANHMESSKPSLDLPKPIKSVANLLNPFKRTIARQESHESIDDDSSKSPQASSDSMQKSDDNEQEFTEQDNNLLLILFRTIIDILEPFKLPTNRQGMFRGTIINDQTNPSRPINDGTNPSESNTDRQGVPQFRIDDLIVAILNFIDAFAKIGDRPEPYRRMDSGIVYENQSYTPLESFIINFDPFRLFANESDYSLGIANILEYLQSLNGGAKQSVSTADSGSQSDNSSTLNRSRRSIRETNCCPIVPSDYRRATGSKNAYKLYENSTNWNDARSNCKNEGAQLALPVNEAQYDAIVEYVKGAINNSSDENFHIGYHSLFSSEKWTTVCGESLPFERWINGTRSDDVTDKKCGGLVISRSNENGFVSRSCNHLLPFICEIIIPSDCP